MRYSESWKVGVFKLCVICLKKGVSYNLSFLNSLFRGSVFHVVINFQLIRKGEAQPEESDAIYLALHSAFLFFFFFFNQKELTRKYYSVCENENLM